MTDFPQAFQSDYNNFQILKMRSVRWFVKLSHLKAQSHMTFMMRLEEFIR